VKNCSPTLTLITHDLTSLFKSVILYIVAKTFEISTLHELEYYISFEITEMQ